MDDIQFCIHTYDGCGLGCSGCLVDKNFKNKSRGDLILSKDDLNLISERVDEYVSWAIPYFNNKESGYFGKNGHQIKHHSYTYRFGDHGELSVEQIVEIADSLKSYFKVFSTGNRSDVSRYIEAQKITGGRYFLEIVFDPLKQTGMEVYEMLTNMRNNNLDGYPEIVITKALITRYSPEAFVTEVLVPFGFMRQPVHLQTGRYTPSKTRNYNQSQMISLDDEVEWLTAMSKKLLELDLNIHPIPLGEYAVTIMDEFSDKPQFDLRSTKENIKDIFMTSLYIDEHLDLYIWAESMGQHVLDKNWGFAPLGNIRNNTIQEILLDPLGELNNIIHLVIRDLISNEKCVNCDLKGFCASHLIPLFRKHHKDDGKHCYGYLPVIDEYKKHPIFLQKMINGFADLEF
jgi:hypothetical protein